MQKIISSHATGHGRARLAALTSILLLGSAALALGDTTQTPTGGGTLVYTNAGDVYSDSGPSNSINLAASDGDTVTATGLTRSAPGALGLNLNGSGNYNVFLRGNTLFGASGSFGAGIASNTGSVTVDTTGGAANTFSALYVSSSTSTVSIITGADTISTGTFVGLYGNAAGNVTINSKANITGATLGYGIASVSGGITTIGNLNGGFGGTINLTAAGAVGIYGSGTGSLSNTNMLTIAAGSSISAAIGIQPQAGFWTVDNFGSVTGTTTALVGQNANYIDLKLESGSSFSGPATFTDSADILEVFTGANISGATFNMGIGPGTDTLILRGTGTDTFDLSKVTNLEALTVSGGTWSLTNTGGYAGGYTIASGGTLSANSNLSANAITIQSGGTLKGTGTVGAISLPSGATVAPGNSIGTLNVGNFTFAAGSTYAVEVDSSGASDKLASTGTVTINGGTVAVTPAAGTYNSSTDYIIITATGGVTGTFTNATSSSIFLSPTLSYTANSVVLTLKQTAQFPNLAQTPNQLASATALQAGGVTGGALFTALLTSTSAANARAGFDAASGEIHATLLASQFEGAMSTRRTLLDRMRAVTPSDPEKGWSVWGAVSGDTGSIQTDGNAATASHNGVNFTVGADTAANANLRLGVEGGYDGGTLNVRDRLSHAKLTGGHVGAYAVGAFDALAIRAGLSYGFGTASTSRTIAFTGFSDSATAKQDADALQMFGEAGWRIPTPGYVLEPYAQLAWVSLHDGAFSETGGSAALSGAGRSMGQAYGTFGLGVTPVMSGAFQPELRAGVEHGFNRATASRNLTFLSSGQSFTVLGTPLDQDRAVVDANLAYNVTGGKLVFGYQGAFGSRATDHAVRLTGIMDF